VAIDLDDIRNGMARALWITAYANWADEHAGEPGVVRATHGADWADVAPETPEAAEEAAAELETLFVAANRVSMADIWRRAKIKTQRETFLFGHYMAMQALGEGVSWFDDHPEFEVRFPRFECHYDGDELVWSGAVDGGRKNPESETEWEKVKVRKGWPETWDRKINGAWYTCEKAANGMWCVGRSHRRGDADYGVDRGIYHKTLEAAQAWCEADAKTWGPRRNPESPHNWPSSEVQSLLFPKDQYTVEGAKKWAEEHGYHADKVDSHASYHRLRQHAPAGGPCRTIEFGAGIKAVVCAKGVGRPPGVPNGKRGKKNPESFADDLEHWDD
jgi:hypothetical protein